LILEKPSMLLQSWPRNFLYKSSPWWIGTIDEVVPFGVGVAVDLKVNRMGMSLGQSCKH
jgi:hypothetical protein